MVGRKDERFPHSEYRSHVQFPCNLERNLTTHLSNFACNALKTILVMELFSAVKAFQNPVLSLENLCRTDTVAGGSCQEKTKSSKYSRSFAGQHDQANASLFNNLTNSGENKLSGNRYFTHRTLLIPFYNDKIWTTPYLQLKKHW